MIKLSLPPQVDLPPGILLVLGVKSPFSILVPVASARGVFRGHNAFRGGGPDYAPFRVLQIPVGFDLLASHERFAEDGPREDPEQQDEPN